MSTTIEVKYKGGFGELSASGSGIANVGRTKAVLDYNIVRQCRNYRTNKHILLLKKNNINLSYISIV